MNRRLLWVVLVTLAVGAGFLARLRFSDAFPVVSVDMSMSREQALGAAAELAHRYGWKPDAFESAAVFDTDREVLAYAELETDRAAAARRLVEEGFYMPFAWRVRLFRPGDIHETQVLFMPDGKPYGFGVRLPENEPGAALEVGAARALAERTARADWGLALDEYDLAESSQKTQTGGRVDHVFVYERRGHRLADAPYRVRLVVGGDRLAALWPFVQIPEAFTRRYEEMRSANETLAASASYAMVVLYGLLGCGGGLFWLQRRHLARWRAPLSAGFAIAAFGAVNVLNGVPLAWMGYDTATDPSVFLSRGLLAAVGTLLTTTLTVGLTLVAAEGLTRAAFPREVQLFRAPRLAGAPAVAGRVLAGYLLALIWLGYVVAFALFTGARLGWWQPTSTLTDPNVLAMAVPALAPIAEAVRAGVWEEALFRAVPLAGAALIGDRFGRRGAFVSVALVVQALVFGAAHANYPQQPAYSRLVELAIPSLVYGLVYLRFGLIVSTVSHVVYDLALMSLPIFVASSSGAELQQILVLGVGIGPLLWVGLMRTRGTTTIPADALNAAPAASPRAEPGGMGPRTLPTAPSSAPGAVHRLGLVGAAGLLAWAALFEPAVGRPLGLRRSEAEAAAREAMAREGFETGAPWQVFSNVWSPPDDAHRYVWQTQPAATYEALVGDGLDPAFWLVRFARFEGEVSERAEEFVVGVAAGTDGDRPGPRVLFLHHQLPEDRAGASLTEDEAVARARAALRENPPAGLSPDALKLVEVKQDKRPARLDYGVIFSEGSAGGVETRVGVTVSGDVVTSLRRFVYVPEDWERDDRNRAAQLDLRTGVGRLLAFLLFLGAVGAGLFRAARSGLPRRTLWLTTALLAGVNLVALANSVRVQQFSFSTAEPVSAQAFRTFAGGAIGAVVPSLLIGLLAGWGQTLARGWPAGSPGRIIVPGFAAGALALGLGELTSLAPPSLTPPWIQFDGAAAAFPSLAVAADMVTGYAAFTVAALVLVSLLGRLARRRGMSACVLACLGVGLVFACGSSHADTLPLLLLTAFFLAATLGLTQGLVFRAYPSAVPVATACLMVLSLVPHLAVGAFPGARLGTLLGFVAVGAMAWQAVAWLEGALAERVAPVE